MPRPVRHSLFASDLDFENCDSDREVPMNDSKLEVQCSINRYIIKLAWRGKMQRTKRKSSQVLGAVFQCILPFADIDTYTNAVSFIAFSESKNFPGQH